MLLTAAALDLTRCGLVMAAARHPGPTSGLVAAGLAAAALTARTARGCRSGRRWSGWAALLIGAVSPPQAAASGFHGLYAIPDTATAILGILLAVTLLATAGHTERQEGDTPSWHNATQVGLRGWHQRVRDGEADERLSGLFRPGRRAERGRADDPGRHAEGHVPGLGEADRQQSGPPGPAAARRPGSDPRVPRGLRQLPARGRDRVLLLRPARLGVQRPAGRAVAVGARPVRRRGGAGPPGARAGPRQLRAATATPGAGSWPSSTRWPTRSTCAGWSSPT